MIFLSSVNRFRHSYGYGIQSPFAYNFIKNVVRGHKVKYKCNLTKRRQQKLQKLYSALVNFWETDSMNVTDARKIVRINIPDSYETYINQATPNTLLIVEGINKSRKSRKLWREIIMDKRTCVTFDLNLCGIVFFDKSKQKQNFTAYL